MRAALVTSAALLCGVATLAQAQTATAPQSPGDEDSAGGTIVVTATGQSAAVSTTKSATPIIESVQAISIISRAEMDLRASPTIADALGYTAGVQSESFGIDSRVDEVSVRGFGAGGFSSNNNFVDGLRLPSGGQWTRPGFDTFALEQIEVLKGPSGALYGQTAPGGVVNIVTKRPTDAFHGEIMAQAIGITDLNNWNWQAAADIGGPVSGDLSARVVGLWRDGDTQVNDVEIGRRYISPSVTWVPADDTTWTILGQYQRDEGGSTFQFLPELGALRPSSGQFIANDDNIGEPDWNTFDRNQYLIGSFFEHRFSPDVALRNNTRYTHLDTLYRVTVLSGNTLSTCPPSVAGCIPGQTVNRRAVQGDGESDGFATDTQLQFTLEDNGWSHTFLAGVDYFHTEWQHYRDLVTRSPVLPLLDIFDPVPRGSDTYEAGLTPQIYTETVSEQVGVYLQDQISIGNLRLTVGGRQDWATDDTFNPINGRLYQNDSDAFTWRAGGVYLFDNGLAPYFSYAQSFQPQVSDPSTSLGGVPFVPTTGDQYEAGLRIQSGNNIYLTAGAFQITQNITTPATLENLPAGSTVADLLCGTTTCLVQTGEGRVRGLELEGKATLPFGLAVIASATHMDSEITETNSPSQLGNELPQVPRWMASLFLNQSIRTGTLEGLGFGGGVRYTGNSVGTAVNDLAIPDYTLFDLFLRYDLGRAIRPMEGLTFSVNARNIADKRFVATCTAVSACYYGQGRSVTARVQYRW